MKKNILYLLNPTANEGYAKNAWDTAAQKYRLLPKDPVIVTKISNLSEFIAEKKPDIVAVAGGDGTINKVCEAVLPLEKRPSVAILPFGYGNAISYCLGVETLEKSLFVLENPELSVGIDVITTTIKELPYCIFNMSVGFDARIVYSRMNYRYIGFRSYIISTIRSIFDHTEAEMTIVIDDRVSLKATASSIVIANCPIIGKNFTISPQARLNDGLLDATIFSTKFAYLSNLRFRGFKHPLYSEFGKVRFKAKKITIYGEPYVQVDGDARHVKEGLTVGILPKKIQFLRNKSEFIDQHYEPFLENE